MRHFIIALLSFSMLFSASASSDELRIKEDAPDQYVVAKGDTLWAIAGRFLDKPWRWPDIWQLNKEEIKNPHWIYPGDVILLDRVKGALRLARKGKYGHGDEKWSPQTRVEPSPSAAIPAISPADIGPFLSQPLVVDGATLANAPRIVANEENRVVIGAGNRAYVTGLHEGGGKRWHVFRPGEQLIDPDTKEVLGVEAVYLGDVRVLKSGEPSTVEVIRSTQEILRDDRLIEAANVDLANFVPHAPSGTIHGRIIGAYGGVAEVGRGSIITLNRGSDHGLEAGNVLAVQRAGMVASYTTGDPGSKPTAEVPLPEERIGLALVFRVFQKVSYALVMKSDLSIHINDTVTNP